MSPDPEPDQEYQSSAASLNRITNATEYAATLQRLKHKEEARIASERATVTASGGTFNLQFSNPSDSGRNVNVISIRVTTQFEGVIDVWDTFTTAPSGGTTATIDNLLLDTEQENGMGVVDANTDVSYTGDDQHYVSVIPSGGPGGANGGELVEGAPLVEPGREFVVEVENQGGSDGEAAISVVYVEEDTALTE